MWNFEKKYEAISDFRDYKFGEIDNTKRFTIGGLHRYKDYNFEFGDWVLFQHILINSSKGNKISRPIYGIFTKWSMWDMAVVFNFIEKERAYMNYYTYISNPDPKYMYRAKLNEFDSDIQTIPLWNEDILILGHWKIKPIISELKSAAYNQFSTSEKRDLLLNIITK